MRTGTVEGLFPRLLSRLRWRALHAVMDDARDAFDIRRLSKVANADMVQPVLVVTVSAVEDAALRHGPVPAAIIEHIAAGQGNTGFIERCGQNSADMLASWLDGMCFFKSMAYRHDRVICVQDLMPKHGSSWTRDTLGMSQGQAVRVMADWVTLHETGHIREDDECARMDVRTLGPDAMAGLLSEELVSVNLLHSRECYADAHATLGLIRSGTSLDSATMAHAISRQDAISSHSCFRDNDTGSEDRRCCIQHAAYNTLGVLDHIMRNDIDAENLRGRTHHEASLEVARSGAFSSSILMDMIDDKKAASRHMAGMLSAHKVQFTYAQQKQMTMTARHIRPASWVAEHSFVQAARTPTDTLRRTSALAWHAHELYGVVPFGTDYERMVRGMAADARAWLYTLCGLPS